MDEDFYDTTNRKLKWERGTTDAPSSGYADWYHGDVISNNSYIGYYVAMKIGGSGSFHIVAYENSSGGIVYIKG